MQDVDYYLAHYPQPAFCFSPDARFPVGYAERGYSGWLVSAPLNGCLKEFFGGEAKVSTLYGDVICRIPEGAQTGRKIRLKGKGIVSMKNPSVHGDQYVTIRIQVPQNLSPEAKEKLREFQQVCRNDERKRRGSVA